MRSQKRVKKASHITDRKRRAKNANKKLKRKKTAICRNGIIGKNWDATKTIKQNMGNLGLAYDPNDVVVEESTEPVLVKEVEVMDIDAAKEVAKLSKGQKKRARLSARKKAAATTGGGDSAKNNVVEALEREALAPTQRQAARAHKDEVRFCSEMIARHGLDFEAISRDPRNIWQHTPAQVRRMVEKFKKSPTFKAVSQTEA